MKLVHDTIERLKKVAEDLKRNDPKSLILYLRPKIHKKVTSMTANLWKYAINHLQPIVKETPSFVNDTQDFLKTLEKTKDISERDSLLATLDAKTQYTNNPNNEGVKQLKSPMRKTKKKLISYYKFP